MSDSTGERPRKRQRIATKNATHIVQDRVILLPRPITTLILGFALDTVHVITEQYLQPVLPAEFQEVDETTQWALSCLDRHHLLHSAPNRFACLVTACFNGRLNLFEWLCDRYQYTADEVREGLFNTLLSACCKGHTSIINALHRRFQLSKKEQLTAIQWSAEYGHVSTLSQLVDEWKLEKQDLKSTWLSPRTLADIIFGGHLDVLKYVHRKTSLTTERIHSANEFGYIGADVDERKYVEVAKFLLQLQLSDYKHKRIGGVLRDLHVRVLYHACMKKEQATVEFLHQHLGFTREEIVSNDNRALRYSCDNTDHGLEIARYLVETFQLRGLDVRQYDWGSGNALDICCRRGNVPLVRYLLTIVQRDTKDMDRAVLLDIAHCALCTAVEEDQAEVMKVIVEECKLTWENMQNWWIMNTACTHGRRKSVEFLCQHFELTVDYFRTTWPSPFRAAVFRGNYHIAEYFRTRYQLTETDLTRTPPVPGLDREQYNLSLAMMQRHSEREQQYVSEYLEKTFGVRLE